MRHAMRSVRVLVTGVSDHSVGGQICKALSLANNSYTVIAANMEDSDLIGLPFDEKVILPRCGAEGYFSALLDFIHTKEIDFIAPGSEPELRLLSTKREDLKMLGTVLLANTAFVIETCQDKGKTFEVLHEKGIRIPVTFRNPEDKLRSDFERGFPWIIKPIRGSGTAGVAIAQDYEEVIFYSRYIRMTGEEPIAQEYFGTPEQEYTVGVLHDKDGIHIGTFAIQRQILTGLSARLKVLNRTTRKDLGVWLALSSGITQGRTTDFKPVLNACAKIAESIGSRGPLNIQGRWDGHDFIPFEINPRFSGTTSMRAMAGFNEPELLIERYRGNFLHPPTQLKRGVFTRRLVENFRAE